jgi:hypothetical protein
LCQFFSIFSLSLSSTSPFSLFWQNSTWDISSLKIFCQPESRCFFSVSLCACHSSRELWLKLVGW